MGNFKRKFLERFQKPRVGDIVGTPSPTFQGIWYYNQPSDDEYRYKYSGGLGTYCAKHRPLAVYSKVSNCTYFCYGGASSSNSLEYMVGMYDHNTKKLSKPIFLAAKKTSDAHDNPIIGLDRKGHIWVFASAHGVSRPSFVFRSITPYSIDKFECLEKTNFSYPQVWNVPSECLNEEFLMFHTKYFQGKRFLAVVPIDNSGKYQSEKVQWISRMEKGHYQVTEPFPAENPHKYGVCFNLHPEKIGLNARTNLYYLEYHHQLAQDSWTNALQIPLSTLPFSKKDDALSCLVCDYQSLGLLVYLKDMCFDADGNPILLYITSPTYESGPTETPRFWTTAYWKDQQWHIFPEPSMAGGIYSNSTSISDFKNHDYYKQSTLEDNILANSNYDTGSLYFIHSDLWYLIAPTHQGPQEFNPGGEIILWKTENHGQSWQEVETLTKNSLNNHTYVRRPYLADPEFLAFWADGNARKPSHSNLYYLSAEFVDQEKSRISKELHRFHVEKL